MQRLALFAVVVFAAAAATSAHGAAAPPCTHAGAKRLILATPALRPIAATVRQQFGGVDQVFCRDLTHDGLGDLTVSIASGGTAGDIAFVVFRRVGPGWKLALAKLREYHLSLVLAGGDVVETTPVYRQNDPNCCPTGGFVHRRFHWTGSRFKLVRRWHSG